MKAARRVPTEKGAETEFDDAPLGLRLEADLPKPATAKAPSVRP
jgi:hypothetical protein